MPDVRVERDARGVATVTLDRPEAHNALSAAMMDALRAAAETLGADPSVRAVVLAGAGASFCAGADLGWMRAQVEADAEGRAREARRLAGMLRALDEMPRPLIGRVQGQAFGGGLGLMAVCDVCVGADAARFAFTEVRLGLIPATIAPYLAAAPGAVAAAKAHLRRLGPPIGEAEIADSVARLVRTWEGEEAAEGIAAFFGRRAPRWDGE